ncbi:GntR family transcriptional regulator [Fictibacillus macauensis ZFHKF-1]|uniref:GntR family transcriptional regulator n=1 Tax=Fictibacillus macauensis ZFHKF-1 TaxID=1196324 RepID=I8AJS6_9BACL|nr:GntR family transcriptional regulator [Fictibacillus macauensis]EIT85799.1 GntR family transcriptional regulator [Fictibacillus macauensis ZFHKF-1]
MLLELNPRSSTPIWEQIVNQVKELLLKNILLPGEKLPSVRELSSLLVINPNTVSKAYQELERQGVIETLRGRGTFIPASLSLKPDEAKLAAVRQTLKQLIIDASYLGMTKEEFLKLTHDYLEEFGGLTDAKRT